MDRMIIGIDPGFSGAISAITPEGPEANDIPTLEIIAGRKRSKKTGKMVDKKRTEYDKPAINRLMLELRMRAMSRGWSVEAWIEKSQAMPDQGAVSNFNYGRGYGILEMGLTCNSIPFTPVHPVSWKKRVMFGQGKDKDGSVLRAEQLFPEIVFRGPRGGLIDGRAEALLIAYYGKLYGETMKVITENIQQGTVGTPIEIQGSLFE